MTNDLYNNLLFHPNNDEGNSPKGLPLLFHPTSFVIRHSSFVIEKFLSKMFTFPPSLLSSHTTPGCPKSLSAEQVLLMIPALDK